MDEIDAAVQDVQDEITTPNSDSAQTECKASFGKAGLDENLHGWNELTQRCSLQCYNCYKMLQNSCLFQGFMNLLHIRTEMREKWREYGGK